MLTICNLMVFPSSSIVLIFCKERNKIMNHISHYFNTHCYTYKINANCADIALCICVIGKSEQQTGLSNARVADQQQFEEIIATRVQRKESLYGYRL